MPSVNGEGRSVTKSSCQGKEREKAMMANGGGGGKIQREGIALEREPSALLSFEERLELKQRGLYNNNHQNGVMRASNKSDEENEPTSQGNTRKAWSNRLLSINSGNHHHVINESNRTLADSTVDNTSVMEALYEEFPFIGRFKTTDVDDYEEKVAHAGVPAMRPNLGDDGDDMMKREVAHAGVPVNTEMKTEVAHAGVPAVKGAAPVQGGADVPANVAVPVRHLGPGAHRVEGPGLPLSESESSEDESEEVSEDESPFLEGDEEAQQPEESPTPSEADGRLVLSLDNDDDDDSASENQGGSSFLFASGELSLATANLVGNGDEEQNLPVALPEDEKERKGRAAFATTWQTVGMFLAAFLLIVLVGGVCVSFALSLKNHSNPIPVAENGVGTLTEEDHHALMRDGILTERLAMALAKTGIENLLKDPMSSQGQALEWILNHDPLALSVKDDAMEFVERFILATFYFATTEEGPWEHCNPPEDDLEKSATQGLCYYEAWVGGLHFGGGIQAYTHHGSAYDEDLAARWLTEHHHCQWAGLFCNEEHKVESIYLREMNLTGTLPAEVALLEDLSYISLHTNEIHGTLPKALSKMKHLTHLGLQNNELTGGIPKEWFQDSGMGRLKDLDLSVNPLRIGAIPTEIGRLTTLESLLLMATGITGTIPSDLYSLTKLGWLLVGNNQITGTLQTEVGLLTSMEFFSLTNNKVSGTVPSEIAQLTDMRELDLLGNEFIGTIPEDIYLSNYNALNSLVLSSNHFSGTISTHVGKLSTLGYLYLDKNALLSGTVPTEIGQISYLQRLHIGLTSVTGSIPEEVCALRGVGDGDFLSRLKADCAPLSDGTTPMFCPEGCCTHCCNQETLECVRTGVI